MIRLQRVVRLVSVLTVVVAAGAAFAAPFSGGRATNQPGSGVATIGSVAAQLGVKVADRADEEFTLGVQFTGSLEEPGKLAAFGIKGMHTGARVVAARISVDRVHVEADELDPPSRASVRLRMDSDGNLVRPPTVAAAPVGD